MNMVKSLLLLFVAIPTLSFARVHCPIPQKTPKKLLASQKQKTSFLYNGQRHNVNFQFQKVKGHRSIPGDIITGSTSHDQLLIAWGDMGIVKYSQKFNQMVDFIPIEDLTPTHSTGEILSLLKKNEHFKAVVFNDHTLQYEKVTFQLSPFEMQSTKKCQTLASH